MEGEYRVIVKFAAKEITNSPFKIRVEGAAGDPKRVSASGPGLEPTGNNVGRRTFFNIFTSGEMLPLYCVVDARVRYEATSAYLMYTISMGLFLLAPNMSCSLCLSQL